LPVGGAAAAFISYRRRRLESFNFFPSIGGAAAVFISCRRRVGCIYFLSATWRLERLQMKNSFQNKKNICLFRYLNVNLFKKKLEKTTIVFLPMMFTR
jgi:hypothetical protein